MNSPFKKDPTPVYEVPFDNPELVAKANKNGSIIVNKDLVKDDKLMDEAMAHEKYHLKDMMNGDLDYDAESVTYKGKKYDRSKFNEGNPNLPWEKGAYAIGKDQKELDVTPKKEKLTGPPAMKDTKESALNFKKIGSSHKIQGLDQNTVKMNEMFGTAMVKKWYGPSVSGGTDDEKKKAADKQEDVEEGADDKADKDIKEDKGETTTSSSTSTSKGEDEKGTYTDTTVKTDKKTTFIGKGTDEDAWRENRDNVQDRHANFEEFQAAAEAWRRAQENESSSETTRVYDPKDNEPEKKVKTPDTKKLATDLFNQYFSQFSRKKIYDSATEKMRPMTQEEILREAPGPLVAKYRKAISEANMTGGEDQSVENVEQGKKKGDENSESPVSMLVSRFKKQALRNG